MDVFVFGGALFLTVPTGARRVGRAVIVDGVLLSCEVDGFLDVNARRRKGPVGLEADTSIYSSSQHVLWCSKILIISHLHIKMIWIRTKG